ncbi:MAG TPA: CPBP family intramembrane glutamic endopeptidase [Terriglobia bacterium]|nr:CPBP family intramembrane glutamic endopeptidase [Terriglobia bacterium]
MSDESSSEQNKPEAVTEAPPPAPEMFPQPPAPEPWKARDLGFFLIFSVAALLISNFAAYAGYAVLKPLMGWRTPTQDLESNPFFLIANQSLLYGLVLGYVYVLVVVHYGLGFWRGLSWRRPTSNQVLGFALAGLALGIGIAHAPTLLPDREDFPLEQLFSSPRAAYAVSIFAIFVAPVIEEVIFRGVLFAFFERSGGLRLAIALTALLFAGLHIPEYWGAWNHVLLIGVVALALSLARGLTGSLAPSIILHLSYNLSLMVALFFTSQHFHALQAFAAR